MKKYLNFYYSFQRYKERKMRQKKVGYLAVFALAVLFLTLMAFGASDVLAAGYEVTLTPIKDVITETQPAVFILSLANSDANVAYEIFSLSTDFSFLGETMVVPSGYTRESRLTFFPKLDKSGIYEVTIFVRNQIPREEKTVTARIRLLTLKDSLSMYVEPSLLKVSDSKLTLIIKNRADNNLENVKLGASSPIFSKDFEFSASAKEELRYEIPVSLKGAEGGQHDIHIKGYQDGTLAFERDIPYTLETIYDFEQSRSLTGFLIREKRLTYDNTGNTKEEVNVEEDMSFLEKIFSYFSEKPAFKTEGGSLKATWDLEVEPYTKEEVVVKTNYLLPLIMLVLIVGGFALTVRYQGKGIIVTKTASRGKSSRGSAFKVTIRVKNRKDAIREVKIKDIFPNVAGAKVHEKFDFIKPAKIGENFVEWHLPLLQGGEERVFTYHIVSENELPGAISLPSATVNYLTLHREPQVEYSGGARVEALQVPVQARGSGQGAQGSGLGAGAGTSVQPSHSTHTGTGHTAQGAGHGAGRGTGSSTSGSGHYGFRK